jgi:cytochrome oxidase Cu insertion factor (SCO1/SenC/PrrC family)
VSIASPNLPQSGGSVAASDASSVARSSDAADVARSENRFQRAVARLFGRRMFWAMFVLIAFSWPISRVIRKSMPPKMPVLGTIGAFALIDQEGQPFGTGELEGRVWVASAVNTSSSSAVDLVKELGKIQHRVRNLGPAFHMVTIGVDPVADAPERLLDFTSRHRVSPRIWSFLSGDAAMLQRAQLALGLELRAPSSPVALAPSAPGSRGAHGAPSENAPLAVAVIDAKMRVRGRYDLADPSAVDTLLYHVGLLVNRGD